MAKRRQYIVVVDFKYFWGFQINYEGFDVGARRYTNDKRQQNNQNAFSSPSFGEGGADESFRDGVDVDGLPNDFTYSL